MLALPVAEQPAQVEGAASAAGLAVAGHGQAKAAAETGPAPQLGRRLHQIAASPAQAE